MCPREGVERPWRVVASHRTYVGHAEGAFEQRAHDAYSSMLVCDGCSHPFDLEAGRPITEAERSELFRAGLGMTLSGMSPRARGRSAGQSGPESPGPRPRPGSRHCRLSIPAASRHRTEARRPPSSQSNGNSSSRLLATSLGPDSRNRSPPLCCKHSRAGSVIPWKRSSAGSPPDFADDPMALAHERRLLRL